jgi:site-specific DNA-cytosine methylase
MGVEQALGSPLIPLAYVERESFAVANLVSKMEASPPIISPAPIWTDVKSFPAEVFRGRVSLITGGYPCQPFSAAGRQEGVNDPRHLWPYIRKIVNTIRPAFVFFENVENHIKIGLSTVLSDLEEDGYRTEWGIFSAEEEGAPQRRKRLFILGKLGDSNSKGCEGSWIEDNQVGREKEKPSSGYDCGNGDVANSKSFRIQGMRSSGKQVLYPYVEKELSLRFSDSPRGFWPYPRVLPMPTDGSPQYWWEPDHCIGKKSDREKILSREGSESKMGRDTNGTSSRMGSAELYKAYLSLGTSSDSSSSEIMMVGNGVVPAVACLAWKILMQKMDEMNKIEEEETLFGKLEEI